MRVPRRSCLAVITGVAALAIGPRVGAQPRPPTVAPADRIESRMHLHRAALASGHRQWATALEEYRLAWRLVPRPAVRLMMVTCELALHRPVDAIQHLEAYLAEEPALAPVRRAAIQRRVHALEAQIAEVTVTVRPATAAVAPQTTVTLDSTGITTDRPLRVGPGHHVLEATSPGFRPGRQEFDALARSHVAIELALDAAPVVPAPVLPTGAPTGAPTVPRPVVTAAEGSGGDTLLAQGQGEFAQVEPDVPTAPAAMEGPREIPRSGLAPAAFCLVAGATVAAGAAWAIAGGLSFAAASDFNTAASAVQHGSTDPAVRREGTQDYARAQQLTTWSDIAAVATVAGVIASVVLYLRTDFGRASAPRTRVDARGLWVTF